MCVQYFNHACCWETSSQLGQVTSPSQGPHPHKHCELKKEAAVALKGQNWTVFHASDELHWQLNGSGGLKNIFGTFFVKKRP